MDKDALAAEFVKIYLEKHGNHLPDDPDKAFDFINGLHKKFKNKMITDLKNKSERFVDRYFDDKDDKYL